MEAFKYYLYNYIITYIPSFKIRVFYLRKILKYEIGKNTFIHMGCFFCGKDIKMGDHTVIGRNCYLGEPLEIGDNVSMTAQTYVFGATHSKNSPIFECTHSKVKICDYCWIGARTVILLGVTLNKGCITGANSTITKSIPELEIWAGSPAKIISKRDSKALKYKLNYFPKFS